MYTGLQRFVFTDKEGHFSFRFLAATRWLISSSTVVRTHRHFFIGSDRLIRPSG